MRKLIALLAVTITLVLAPFTPAFAGNKGDGNFCPGRNNTCGGGGGGGGGDDGDGDTITISKKFCQNKADGHYLVNAQIVVCIGGVVIDVL